MRIRDLHAMPILGLLLGAALSLSSGCESNVEARRDAALAYERGDYERSATLYEQVLERRPEDPEANLGLGKALLAAGETVPARSHLAIAYQHSWDHPNESYAVAGYLAEAMAQGSDTDRLFQLLRDRAETTGESRDYVRWGDYAMRFGDPDSAELAYRTAARLSEGNDAEPYYKLALLYDSIGDASAADRRLRQAYGIAPHDAEIIAKLRERHAVVGPSLALPPD
ncbi:MAG: tetratricopeptide repeat protein [Phycisphaerales bacterium]